MRQQPFPAQPEQKLTVIHEAVRDRRSDATAPDFAIGVEPEAARAAIAHARQMAETQQAISNLVRRQAVVALKHAGLSVRDIAKELRLSHSDVHRLLTRSPDEFRSDARPLEDAPFRAAWGAAISGTSTTMNGLLHWDFTAMLWAVARESAQTMAKSMLLGAGFQPPGESLRTMIGTSWRIDPWTTFTMMSVFKQTLHDSCAELDIESPTFGAILDSLETEGLNPGLFPDIDLAEIVGELRRDKSLNRDSPSF